MRRQAKIRRSSTRSTSPRTDAIAARYRHSFEPLEARRMLAAQDLLVGLYDGGGTLRYNEAAQAPAAGAVAPGDNGLQAVSGEAVAPDGTFYVSSIYTGAVYHYSNAGVFLGTLGENDLVQQSLNEPGTLAFGPNGNLYVADLATSSIYQFDVNSATQQFQPDDTLTLTAGGYPGEHPSPGGFAFAANGDLIVGDIADGSVANYHDDPTTGWALTSYYVQPLTDPLDSHGNPTDASDSESPWMNPASILVENNGDLLIADLDYDGSNAHHQVVLYNATTQAVSQFIDLDQPEGTNTPEDPALGNPAQPEALLLDQNGDLLVGVSPDHNGNGAVQQYNINTGAYLSTVVSNIPTPAGLAYIPSENADLLVGDYDDSSVLRYDDSTDAAVPGGVPSYGDEGELYIVSGLAVASDGTYYASSIGTGQVLHYASNGNLLGVLGQNDATQAPLYEPGNLAFGPNGNLYVGDLATASILQFDVNSTTQQYQPDDTLSLTAGGYPGEHPSPGGFTFAANGDLIVGDIADGSVANYHDDPSTGWAQTGYYVQPLTDPLDSHGNPTDMSDSESPWMNPASIVRESNGDLLIADLDYDGSNAHHQVVLYNAATQTISQFIDLDQPEGTNTPDDPALGNPAQPESLLLDQDGNLLVAVSPDHNGNGAVQKYNVTTGAYISTIISGIGTPAGLAMTAPIPIVSTSGGATNYTAGATAVSIDAALTLADANTLPSLSATVTISAATLQSGDTLHFTNQNGISGTYASGTLTLSGSATLAQYQTALQSVSFSSTNTSTAERTISFSVTDGTQSSVIASKAIDVSAPITVTGAWVENPTWGATGNTNFFGYLASHSLGSATLGYALKTGASQLTVLPFANINTISVQFSGAVSNIGLGSLMLAGGTGGGATGAAVAPPSVTGFTSDGNNTYSWTLSANLTNNKYVFAIATTGSSFGTPGSTQVIDGNGAGISGTFTTGSSTFPSGNGLAGSTFDFAFNVLPADGLQNGVVSVASTSAAKALNNDKETAAAYNPYYDYNGAGIITVIDASLGAADNNDKQSSITSPAAPSASQAVVGAGSAGFTALALAVQETGSSQSSTATPSSIVNVVSTSSPSTSTPAAVTLASSGSSSSAPLSTVALSQTTQNLATDQAVSEFDLAELWA